MHMILTQPSPSDRLGYMWKTNLWLLSKTEKVDSGNVIQCPDIPT